MKKLRTYPHPKENGRLLPSVTEILGIVAKPELYYWYSAQGAKKAIEVLEALKAFPEVYLKIAEKFPNLKSGEQQAKEAADIGTEVHEAVEADLKGIVRPGALSPPAQRAFEGYLKWKETRKLVPMALEWTVYGDDYAGTCDFMGLVEDSVPVIMDWKTSKAIYWEYRLQMAAYVFAAKRSTQIDHAEVVRFDKKTGEIENVRYALRELLEAMGLFDAAKELWYGKYRDQLKAEEQNVKEAKNQKGTRIPAL